MVKNPGEEYPSDSDGEGRERLRSTETLEDVDNDIETFDGDIETFDEPDNKPMETFDDAIETFENSIENNEIEPVDQSIVSKQKIPKEPGFTSHGYLPPKNL